MRSYESIACAISEDSYVHAVLFSQAAAREEKVKPKGKKANSTGEEGEDDV